MDSDDSDDFEIKEESKTPADKEDDKDANGKRASEKNAKISMTKGDNYTKLTFTQCNRIILQIEINPCLWNLREKDYKDAPLKNGLWTDIEKLYFAESLEHAGGRISSRTKGIHGAKIHNETPGFVRRDVGVDTPKRMKREKCDRRTGSDGADADLKLFMKESREVLRSFG
ncbi:unnamed protein product [Caenorhabditis sp. 36 PRJEB53466]|nr:unnamed protein product [Caenorhabditis sp. 36 PRJEB53466]